MRVNDGIMRGTAHRLYYARVSNRRMIEDLFSDLRKLLRKYRKHLLSSSKGARIVYGYGKYMKMTTHKIKDPITREAIDTH